MWTDTHCHLDADVFNADRDAVVARAQAAGVTMAVVAAGHVDHFAGSCTVAHRYGFAYALGIHPLWVGTSCIEHLQQVRWAAEAAKADSRFVAIGEIGLDFFVEAADVAQQESFYAAQLRIARDLDLPVIVHVRRSADALLKHLGRIPVSGGIVHAFNGSMQQAKRFIERGFCLGFGGAATYAGSRRIRSLAQALPIEAIVVETDAPDIPPQWLRESALRGERIDMRNEPAQLPRIAAEIAALRNISAEALALVTAANAHRVLPRLGALVAGSPIARPAPA